jgi:hypothetical protein
VLPAPFSVLLSFFNVEFHTLTINITTPLLSSDSLILFNINPALEFLPLAVIFGFLSPMAVIDTYRVLLLRLSKDATLRDLRFIARASKLPDSTRYRNYGEAKARIKHLIRKGTRREKTAIFAWGVCYIGLFLCAIFFVFSLFGILPAFPFRLGILIALPVALVMVASERFMWNTIQ